MWELDWDWMVWGGRIWWVVGGGDKCDFCGVERRKGGGTQLLRMIDDGWMCDGYHAYPGVFYYKQGTCVPPLVPLLIQLRFESPNRH